MGKTDGQAAPHKQQSMILVPMDTPGVRVLRHLSVFGYDDAPHGHMEIDFDDVKDIFQTIPERRTTENELEKIYQ
jgi:acyl-CoA dehydrogenase